MLATHPFCIGQRLPTLDLVQMRVDFLNAIAENQKAFGLELRPETGDRLADHFEIVLKHNPLLHLVAPCSPEQFAIRHVLESLILTHHLPPNSRLADVGAGAGLPSIPCLIARNDLAALLIESKKKKSDFLVTAANELGIAGRAAIINKQFEETRSEQFTAVTCRALDRFSEKLPRLLKWSKGRVFYLFGGPSLGEALTGQKVRFESHLLPMSEQRFLFVGTA